MEKPVKKILNIEYDLNSTDFISQKMDSVADKFQTIYGDGVVCKVTTFCVADATMVEHTTEDNVSFMGASEKMLSTVLMSNETFLAMDDDMVRTYEITITANTDLPNYVTALNVAQAKADAMFEEDDSKMPLVTVIDYRWGNPKAVVGASIFSTTDEDGNKISLIGATDSAANVVVGDANLGKIQDFSITKNYDIILNLNLNNTADAYGIYGLSDGSGDTKKYMIRLYDNNTIKIHQNYPDIDGEWLEFPIGYDLDVDTDYKLEIKKDGKTHTVIFNDNDLGTLTFKDDMQQPDAKTLELGFDGENEDYRFDGEVTILYVQQ